MFRAAPRSFNLNRTLLRSLRLQNHFNPTHELLAESRQPRYLSLAFARRFTTSGISGQDPPTEGDKPDTPAVRKYNYRRIRTLNPDILTPDDFLDLSLTQLPSLRVILRSADRPACQPRLLASPLEWSARVFPADTQGFLYYHIPPNGPPLAGELRFRVTHSRNPASFAAGSDLLTEHGLPWKDPLYKIVHRPVFREIVALLLQDGLVTQRTLDLVTTSMASLRAHTRHTAQITDALRMSPNALSAFGQEFVYRLGATSNTGCLFIGSNSILRQDTLFFTSLRVPVPSGNIGKYKYVPYFPFEGSVIAAFERSTLPEHAGRRVVVMRIKRFCDSDPVRDVPAPRGHVYPVEALRPREGELAKTLFHGQVRPWAVDVDKDWKKQRALRTLFENEELYGFRRQSVGE